MIEAAGPNLSGQDAPSGENGVRPEAESGWLARLRDGDASAFEWLVREHGGRLLSVARRFLRDEEDARDAVQETFLSAYRSIGDFAGGSRLSTWLHRIVINACLMRLRTRRRKPEERIDDLLPRFAADGHQENHPTLWWEGSAEAMIERSQTRAIVRQAIDRLSDPYRTVLLLRDIEEISTGEAARLLGVTENAVKIRLHRARQALRTLLEPHFREPER
ncbi:MAG TPA: sigma-70 family RNA polymerase sigma factor [Thermoanaerobaculia bacterium]|nr:sigma-70 family RNA polymerase sigma factor [Thermoanaerobaculia bacterium]